MANAAWEKWWRRASVHFLHDNARLHVLNGQVKIRGAGLRYGFPPTLFPCYRSQWLSLTSTPQGFPSWITEWRRKMSKGSRLSGQPNTWGVSASASSTFTSSKDYLCHFKLSRHPQILNLCSIKPYISMLKHLFETACVIENFQIVTPS